MCDEENFKEFCNKATKSLKMDLSDLTKDMSEQAALFARYSVKAAMLRAKVNKLKAQLDELEAMLNLEVRDTFTNSGRKYTEALVESTVLTDSRRTNMQNELLEAQRESSIMDAIVNAYKQKAEMLISAGADIREERKRMGMNIQEN